MKGHFNEGLKPVLRGTGFVVIICSPLGGGESEPAPLNVEFLRGWSVI